MKQIRNKTIVVVAIILTGCIQSFSQKDTLKNNGGEFEFDTNEEEMIEIEEITEDEEDRIYIYVETMPEFPGGNIALRRFIAEHIEFPIMEGSVYGTVYLRFEVKKTGDIGTVQIQKGVDPFLDKEAERVIKLLPNFIPGEQNGKKVNVWYSIPISFKIN